MCCFSKSIILEKIHEEIFKSKLPDNFIERTPFHGFSHVELLQNFEKLKYQFYAASQMCKVKSLKKACEEIFFLNRAASKKAHNLY